MRVIDSHTEGEPTRTIIDGGPDLGDGPLAERRQRFAERFDHVRSFAVNEPRGSDAVVGALVCAPVDPTAAAGVIFFNNVGYLGMCGHGTIGVAVTLHHLGRLALGTHRFETPVGMVSVDLLSANERLKPGFAQTVLPVAAADVGPNSVQRGIGFLVLVAQTLEERVRGFNAVTRTAGERDRSGGSQQGSNNLQHE